MDNLTPITREEMLLNDEPLTPITREEKILAGEDLNPVTRREYFLKKYRHAGGDVMVEGLEVTANGTYTAPEGKAYSPVEVAVPLPDNAYLLKEASGSLVSFSDGADLPMPSFVCNIDAVQDLHGQDAPWVGGSNINLFDIKAKLTDNARTYTMGGITYTRIDDSDGNALSVKGTGTATEYSFCDIPVTLPAGRYKTNVSGSDANKMGLNLRNSNRSYFKEGNEEFTLTEQTSMYIRYLVDSGNIADNTITCMLYKYDGTDKDFVPYENICPISGHTGVDAVISPTTEASAGTTYSVSWQTEAGEVFGGYVDLVSGVLTVTHKGIDMGTLSWGIQITAYNDRNRFRATLSPTAVNSDTTVGSKSLCSSYKLLESGGTYSTEVDGYTIVTSMIYMYVDKYRESTSTEFKTAMDGVQLVYELAAPITYQLTPTQIKSLLGNNNAWCSTGDTDIDYFAKEVTG